jgi:hypothetical protein
MEVDALKGIPENPLLGEAHKLLEKRPRPILLNFFELLILF